MNGHSTGFDDEIEKIVKNMSVTHLSIAVHTLSGALKSNII